MTDPSESADVKTWLRSRLLGDSTSDIDFRRDESPYEKAVELWNKSNPDSRSSFLRAILELITEAVAKPWPAIAFNELMHLIEAANLFEAVDPLKRIAYSRILAAGSSGQQLHMLALRTLLALRWTGTTEFWLAQRQLVDGRWPALIFEGLARNDLQMAFECLPDLVTTSNDMAAVTDLFPVLMGDLKVTANEMWVMIRPNIDKLRHDSRKILTEWFDSRTRASGWREAKSWVLNEIEKGIEYIKGPVKRESRSPRLCGRKN